MAHTGEAPAGLVVGPLLRYVDDTRATIWVEADRPCEVEVLEHRERTWTLHGHHYAIIVIEGLQPGTETTYEVRLDGVTVWPEPNSPHPPSVIRTPRTDDSFRLAFGSCRRSAPFDAAALRKFGADALVAMARGMAATPYDRWPDALLMLGDQIYADNPSDKLTARLKEIHSTADGEVRTEIQNFEEYTWLYTESWMVPEVRWLLSTVPSCMILDDHDLRDDWNTSRAWREEVTAKPWWPDRVRGAFGSYWVYQHLGNLSPAELAEDDLYRKIRETPDDEERGQLLDDFAWRADAEPDSTRWSFSRDFGRVRLIVVDSRCARVLDPEHRAMVDEVEWRWVVEQAHRDVDHLLIGTSLPFLLLHGIHDLEGWNESTAHGAWGKGYSWIAERVRRGVDLEHWAAFRASFDGMVELIQSVSRTRDTAGALSGTATEPPASVLVLSGDVHCSYVAEAQVEGVDASTTRVHQLVQSPFRNPMELPLRWANKLFDTGVADRVFKGLARRAGVSDPPISWRVGHGPLFDNGIMTLHVKGRRAQVEIDGAVVRDGEQVLRRVRTVPLA